MSRLERKGLGNLDTTELGKFLELKKKKEAADAAAAAAKRGAGGAAAKPPDTYKLRVMVPVGEGSELVLEKTQGYLSVQAAKTSPLGAFVATAVGMFNDKQGDSDFAEFDGYKLPTTRLALCSISTSGSPELLWKEGEEYAGVVVSALGKVGADKLFLIGAEHWRALTKTLSKASPLA